MTTFPAADPTTADAALRAHLYREMETALKELVNLLVPSEIMLNKASVEGLASDDDSLVTVRRDELDSLVHLVGTARTVADRLREIMRVAKIKVEESQVRDDPWKPDARDVLRAVKSA